MQKPTQIIKVFTAVLLVLLAVGPAAAVWEQNGFLAEGEALWQDGGVPVCTYPGGTQVSPALSSDNVGGAYFIWQDVTNGGTAHVYAQHVNRTGVQSWATNGIMLDDTSPASVTSTMMITAIWRKIFLPKK